MEHSILTARLRLRPFETHDARSLFALFRRREVGRYTGGPHATADDSRRLIETHQRHQAEHGFALWAIEEREGGRLVGEAGLQLLEQRGPEVEIGWVLDPDVWGRGYATEAAGRWLELGFDELGLDRVIATILPDNAASQAVAGRLGMALEGRRHVHDAEHLVYAATVS